jgi:hypothetical protein
MHVSRAGLHDASNGPYRQAMLPQGLHPLTAQTVLELLARVRVGLPVVERSFRVKVLPPVGYAAEGSSLHAVTVQFEYRLPCRAFLGCWLLYRHNSSLPQLGSSRQTTAVPGTFGQ